jgi:hypothetical protein
MVKYWLNPHVRSRVPRLQRRDRSRSRSRNLSATFIAIRRKDRQRSRHEKSGLAEPNEPQSGRAGPSGITRATLGLPGFGVEEDLHQRPAGSPPVLRRISSAPPSDLLRPCTWDTRVSRQRAPPCTCAPHSTRGAAPGPAVKAASFAAATDKCCWGRSRLRSGNRVHCATRSRQVMRGHAGSCGVMRGHAGSCGVMRGHAGSRGVTRGHAGFR